MFQRAIIALLLLARVALFSLCGTSAVAAEKRFDLAERKQKQPWLWEAPRQQTPPSVINTEWPRSMEDRFILHSLESAGLSPARPADPHTWLRRVHFIITGLPPSREEMASFSSDTSPVARAIVVDRLLASPHFGERWARHWMDLMRYAESRGHEGDYIIANAWRYRDYLIRAFNEDVPYDQFLLEHLAGDLMPSPRLQPGSEVNESVVATGWAFLGEENHSPVDIRQDECERIDNKVDVFSKTFLGLTVSCARCHDHKFDPIRAQDYYAMSGFFLGSRFRQVRFEAMENNRQASERLSALRGLAIPEVAHVIARHESKGVDELSRYLVAASERITSLNAKPASAGGKSATSVLNPDRLERWTSHLRAAKTNSAHPLHALAGILSAADEKGSLRDADAVAGPKAESALFPMTGDGIHVVADFTQPGRQPWKVDGHAFGDRVVGIGEMVLSAAQTNAFAQITTYGAARRDLFWSRLKLAGDNQNDSGALGATSRAGQTLFTPTVTLASGKLHYLIKGRTKVYASVDSHLMIDGPLHGRLVQTFDTSNQPMPQWVTHDLSAYKGHRVHVELGPQGDGELEVLMVVDAETAPGWRPSHFVFNMPGTHVSREEAAQEFSIAVRAALDALTHLGPGSSITNLQDAALANWALGHVELFGDLIPEDLVRLKENFLREQERIASGVKWESHTAIAWSDGTGVDENILLRGKPTQPGAVSPRSLPVAFSTAKPITTQTSSGRLELGQALIDPANPLVARTIVNRVWGHVFGRGIVATVDNFGALGERPTHPELLDHLAYQFIHEDRWSLKQCLRRLLLTQTFAMTSQASDAPAEEKDPSNALLHRMPVRRMEGELIRDAALAVSGRLNPRVGGPSIQVHLTDFLVGRGRPEPGGPLDGEGRRSLYTAIRRNFLPTLMQTFDTPTPFTAVGRRNVTNVPGQSLALMNDPFFHEQSRVWAERILREMPKADDASRIRVLIESVYGRPATPTEVMACRESLGDLRSLHDTSTGGQAEAWGDLCHALFNANDFIYVK